MGCRTSQNASMSKKDPSNGDRHKPRKMVGIRKQFIEPLEQLAEDNGTKVTDEVNRAVRELLEREGRYKPKRRPTDSE